MAGKLPDKHNDPRPRTPEGLFIDALFTSIGDGAIATDEVSRIVRINKAALNILGYTREDVINKWYPGTIVAVNEDGSEVSLLDRSISKAFITGKSITENSYYLNKNGQKIPVSITVSPILIDGRPVGAINLFRDITQEYEIDRIKSEFISLASHQLRTPLSSIKTYSHMLLEGFMGALNDDQIKALESVVDASDRMNQLTDTLLNITRIEAGSMTISKKEVEICSLAEKVIKEQSLDAEAKNISVTLNAPKKSTLVNTDKFIIKEILTNLLSNAIKYTPDNGKISIEIKPAKDEVVCRVVDTGIGIPKNAQEQIFDKFYRAPNVAERDTTGTGLGLYLIKSLADRINIPIWFESEEGKGSSFCFSLPAAITKKVKVSQGAKRN
jgi:PAS domain S-box-containing protein